MEEANINVKYWGTRGSIPTPITSEQIREKEIALIEEIIKDGGIKELFGNNPNKDKMIKYLDSKPLSLSGTYGGDTTCVEIQVKDSPLIIFDAGSGIRNLGSELVGRILGPAKNFNPLNSKPDFDRNLAMFFTHYHWDHIQGFPFFIPGFLPKDLNVFMDFYGKKNGRKQIEDVLRFQQEHPNFPVEWHDMTFAKEFNEFDSRLEKQIVTLGQAKIEAQELTHPDAVFAYAVSYNGKKFVFATDTEHKDAVDPRLISIAKNADVLYYDSHFTPKEYVGTTPGNTKFDWGHSTYEWAIRTALVCDVKTVVLGHTAPERSDFQVEKEILDKAKKFKTSLLRSNGFKGKKLEVIHAYDGLEHKL